ncbi:MAG TPA: sulfotransferase [Gaiellales bacterium]|nr:sulfotransferase [Gaiellales bacterium]
MSEHTMVFVGGLHRSGTSLVHRCLASHPDVSGFSGTGVEEDEGQHLQTVYPPARQHGGPGRFGFDPAAHLTDASPLAGRDARDRLMSEWGRHWDMTRPVLVEKSPPNLIRTRFLQEVFPGCRQIVVIRHPIAVACATQKWSWTSYTSLIEHWLVCHETLLADLPHVERLMVIRYEDFVASPDSVLAEAFGFVGVAPRPSGLAVRADVNDAYFRRFRSNRWNPLKRFDTDRARDRMTDRVARFGYSLAAPADRGALPPELRSRAAAAVGG